MGNAAVAYYTNGQRRGDGASIIIEQFFKNTDEMMMWLRTAMSSRSVASNVLRLEGSEVVLPTELRNPKRKRLLVPARSTVGGSGLVHMMASAFYGGDDDIACMRDVEGMTNELADCRLSYFA
jgi:hypothetical protein